MDKLKAMGNFVRIVDSGSLSSAAQLTGQSVASLVRSLAALERYLGVRLLNRTTRRMALTDEGEAYLGWSRRMLADFDGMEQQLQMRDGKVRGLLRVTAPVEFGQRFIAPLVNGFLQAHGDMAVELSLDDHIVPLVDQRLDIALRISHLPDSAMVARHVGSTRLVTCASPAYLQGAAPLDSPAALAAHPCIALNSQGRQWYYKEDGKERVQDIVPRLQCNQVRSARLACVEGLGVTRLMHYQVADELAEGRLIRVLQRFEPADLPIQLVYPHGLQLSPRVKAFVDWAQPQLERMIPDPTCPTP